MFSSHTEKLKAPVYRYGNLTASDNLIHAAWSGVAASGA
ncbi:hypothetical protein ECP03052936_1028 [Escherichia coli p0305293.6]|nr:hypothetical protein ECP03052936_1028 [Escherichia coli p0305293.6]